MLRRSIVLLLFLPLSINAGTRGSGFHGWSDEDWLRKELQIRVAASRVRAHRIANLRARIVDPAGVIPQNQRPQLRALLDNVDLQTGALVLVVATRTYAGANLDQYLLKSLKVHKEIHNHPGGGVLLFLATDDNLVRIRPTPEFEKSLPREVRQEIIRRHVLPLVIGGDIVGGIRAGIVEIARAINPAFEPKATRPLAGMWRAQQRGNQPVPDSSASVNDEAAGEDTTAPSVTIREPAVSRGITFTTSEKLLTVRGTAHDPAGIYEVDVNGTEASVSANGDFVARVKLAVGENSLRVKVSNLRNSIAEESFAVVRQSSVPDQAGETGGTPDVSSGEGKYYALVIGIDAYAGVWPHLTNAVHDAQGVSEALRGSYRFEKVVTLFDTAATRVNIIRQLEWLTKMVKPNDNVLVYFSGHGDYNRQLNRGSWVPSDARSQSTADMVSNADIQTFLGGIPSKHTLLIADACFSGDIFRGLTERTEFEDSPRYYEEVSSRSSRQAITSGGVEPVMDGGRDGHSVFTYYLLKALGDNKKKQFDAGELFEAIKIPVANNSDQTPVFQAVKNTGDEGGQFVFLRKLR